MKPPLSHKFQLFAVFVFGVVGALAIVGGRLRSATVHEMSVSGFPARVVGACYIIMAVMLLVDWLKKQKQSRQ